MWQIYGRREYILNQEDFTDTEEIFAITGKDSENKWVARWCHLFSSTHDLIHLEMQKTANLIEN